MTGKREQGGLEEERAEFHREIEAKKERVKRAEETGDRTLRVGLGAFGVVGWSIAVPTVLGIAIGLRLDQRAGGGIRFTLSLMVLGVIVGMINVWKWMNTE